jgi:copper chaperone NosL
MAALLLLAGCGDDQQTAAKPTPVTPDREAITYFGQMILLDHQGPKAQIMLKSAIAEGRGPLWFPSVRDVVAFTKLPDEPKDIAAIYVTDMARAGSWDDPQVWMDPAEGFFVIESDVRGGMGAPEAVPFSARNAAEDFAHRRGGHIVRWQNIPEDYVLSDAAETMGEGGAMAPHGAAHPDPLNLAQPGALCTAERSSAK